jgi:hypothetical protein
MRWRTLPSSHRSSGLRKDVRQSHNLIIAKYCYTSYLLFNHPLGGLAGYLSDVCHLMHEMNYWDKCQQIFFMLRMMSKPSSQGSGPSAGIPAYFIFPRPVGGGVMCPPVKIMTNVCSASATVG